MKINLIRSPNNWKKFEQLNPGDWFVTTNDPVQQLLNVHLKTENFRLGGDGLKASAVDMDGTFKFFMPNTDVCLLEDVSFAAKYNP